MAAYTWEYELLFIHEDERHKVSGRWASEDFFSIFSVDFIEGSKENSLTSPSEVYLSKSTKERLFGEEPALSKTIEIDGYGSYQVAGVFDDVPNESTIDFDFITPYEVWAEWNNWVTDWDNHGVRGIAKLQPGVEINAFNAKIEEYVQEKLGDDEEAIASIFLQPLKDRYLYNSYENGQLSGGRITYVRLFSKGFCLGFIVLSRIMIKIMCSFIFKSFKLVIT